MLPIITETIDQPGKESKIFPWYKNEKPSGVLPHEIFMCMYWRNEYAASHKIHFCKHNTFEDFLLLYNSDELGYNLKTAGKCNFQCTE